MYSTKFNFAEFKMRSDLHTKFLQWALPQMGYRWPGFRKPRGQVIKRILGRMQELQLSGGFSQYRSYLEDNPEEWYQLEKLCDVTISRFFRDREVWDFLRWDLLKHLLHTEKTEPLQIWSAGCCNGEEPYSVSMVYEMLSKQGNLSRGVSILATDRNSDVLSRAMRGEYPGGALSELTEEEIRTFFEKISNGDDEYRIRNRVKQNTEFEQRDIRHSIPDRLFDIVFCRNLVFTYFEKKEQQRFLDRVYSALKNGGYLIIGSDEKIPRMNWLKTLPNRHPVYQKIAYD